jgi:hypothetical protein
MESSSELKIGNYFNGFNPSQLMIFDRQYRIPDGREFQSLFEAGSGMDYPPTT